MKENMWTIVVSVAVGLLAGFLIWGVTSAWGSMQSQPAMMNGNGMMGSTTHNGAGTMSSGMMGGMMMQGMMNGSGVGPAMMQSMGQMHGMMSPEHEQMMSGHMAQGHEMMESMMGMMQGHSHALPSDEKQ